MKSPILNNPYDEPARHYSTDASGALNYENIIQGRRIFDPNIEGLTIPARQNKSSMFDVNDFRGYYDDHPINSLRKEVGRWRNNNYSNVTSRVTNELLNFWFINKERHAIRKLFFAQREAIETAIWINEIAGKSNAGQKILNDLKAAQTVSENKDNNLPRIAFKMATGTGKTVVMAAIILYHYFNRTEYRNDTSYADNFLIVAPGITIKDRLGVLFVDTYNKNPRDIQDYYHIRGLVPASYEKSLPNLNSKIVITNYHAFERRSLQGNKKSPFDGKVDAGGNKVSETENFNQMIKRVIGKFKKGSRLLIINDEAHHCYLPKAKGQKTEGENTQEENARAAVWFTGISEMSKKFKVRSVYDLSATPYFLTGSGYLPYSLFPWVVSDYGLIESIESGLVKIPFMPISDSTQELETPVLKNLYEHVRDELPRKGRKKRKSEAKKEGTKLIETSPTLPFLVKSALKQFYDHYLETYKGSGQMTTERTPPVFIVVCNNTSVSKEVYKYIAGYENINPETGETHIVSGAYDLFSNYNPSSNEAVRKPPTLLIDSDALENSDQVDKEFKEVFANEIETFKREYRINHPDKSPENLTDADILREVVNTVGKPNSLGSHVRCVVSVSMLTEGWDANTVTHIVGLRAFGSQLLCEQVAGRALRRQNYYLQGYDLRGNPTTDKRKIVEEKFPPEYAHIIGVPFKVFKGGETQPPPPRPDMKHIFALKEREEDYEISYPLLKGYRVDSVDGELQADFTGIDPYEIDGSKYPIETTLGTAFSEEEKQLQLALERRDQEIIYHITKTLIRYKFSDDDGKPYFRKFNQLKHVAEQWYRTNVKLVGITEEKFKKIVFLEEPKKYIENIYRGIAGQLQPKSKILPVFLNPYEKFGSTKYVYGHTSKQVYPTEKSHVNYVVADTKSWEQIAAKTLEQISEVEAYVKNAFLGFSIPYIKESEEKEYYPDFIVRCRANSRKTINLIIEVTGMNNDKADKKWYVENRWLPAVNNVREKYGYDEWHFIEIGTDNLYNIRNAKNEILDKINSL